MISHEAAAAITRAEQELARRLSAWDGQEPGKLASEFITAMMRHDGWRPTSARASWDYRNAHHGDGMPTSEESQREIDAARERLREIARRPQAGDAA
jgi:hypothetical protein